jgi:hypothetical protein
VKRLLSVLAIAAFISACGSSSTTAPTPVTTATPTKIITVSGALAFGNVNIGESPTRTFTIGNSGNALLTYTGFTAAGGTGAVGFTASPLTGTVQPGGSQTVTVRFTPTIAQFYSNVLSVTGDQTSGGAAINVSGVGINNAPLFTANGSGNTVFDMPTTVTRIHIVGTYTGNSSNFIVTIGGHLVVNDIIGTSATFGSRTVSDGIYLTTGGVVAITNSLGVVWSFAEVRQ